MILRRTEQNGEPPITAEELAGELKLRSNSIGRLMALLRAEGLVLDADRGDDGNSHTLFISSDIRRFRTVNSLADYLAIKSQIRKSVSEKAYSGPRVKIANWWSNNTNLTVIIALTGIILAILAIIGLVIAH
jgi:hypothetical protein